mmetsp:Transcript_19256/g.32681  ORF Transcript_19256/g.32681 Transcript_19256/m.32681 type:complete len:206 (+) Transcript_19256:961-1578(+)
MRGGSSRMSSSAAGTRAAGSNSAAGDPEVPWRPCPRDAQAVGAAAASPCSSHEVVAAACRSFGCAERNSKRSTLPPHVRPRSRETPPQCAVRSHARCASARPAKRMLQPVCSRLIIACRFWRGRRIQQGRAFTPSPAEEIDLLEATVAASEFRRRPGERIVSKIPYGRLGLWGGRSRRGDGCTRGNERASGDGCDRVGLARTHAR